MEKAKPSYLDRMKEDKEGSPEKEEESKTADVPKREPISGIPNTLTIRKSKRKFLVVSETPVINWGRWWRKVHPMRPPR